MSGAIHQLPPHASKSWINAFLPFTFQTFHTQPAVLTTTFHQNAPLTLQSKSDHSTEATFTTTGEDLRL